MPSYEVTSPEGQKFIVTAPDGASPDEVLSYAKANFGKADAPSTGSGPMNLGGAPPADQPAAQPKGQPSKGLFLSEDAAGNIGPGVLPGIIKSGMDLVRHGYRPSIDRVSSDADPGDLQGIALSTEAAPAGMSGTTFGLGAMGAPQSGTVGHALAQGAKPQQPAMSDRDLVINAASRLSNRFDTPLEIPRGALVTDRMQSIAGSLADTPFAGTPLKNAAALNTDRLKGIADIVMERYGRTSAESAGEGARDAMQTWIKKGSGEDLSKVYQPIKEAMSGAGPRPLEATKRVVADLERDMKASTSKLNKPAIDLVNDAIERPEGLTHEGLSQLITDIGARIDDPDPAAGTVKPALRRIYGALSEDRRTMIEQQGGAKNPLPFATGHNLIDKFDNAQEFARSTAAKRDQLRKIIGNNPETTSGESVTEKLVKMAGSKQTADISKLTQARSVIGEEEWGAIAGEAIARLGRDRSGELNPAILGKNYTALSDGGRDALFGASGEMRASMDDIVEVSKIFDQMAKLGNPSGSGRMIIGWSLISGLFPHVSIKGAAGAYMLAKWWARPAAARVTADWGKAAVAAAKAPSAVTLFALQNATRALAVEASQITGERPEVIERRMQQSQHSNVVKALVGQN